MAFNREGSRSETGANIYDTSTSFLIPPASSHDELLLGTPNHRDFLHGMEHSSERSDVPGSPPRKTLGFLDLSQLTPRRRSPRKHRTPAQSRRNSPEKLSKILEIDDGQEDHLDGEQAQDTAPVSHPKERNQAEVSVDGGQAKAGAGGPGSGSHVAPKLSLTDSVPGEQSDGENLLLQEKRNAKSQAKRPIKPKHSKVTQAPTSREANETQAQTASAKPHKDLKTVAEPRGLGSASSRGAGFSQRTFAREVIHRKEVASEPDSESQSPQISPEPGRLDETGIHAPDHSPPPAHSTPLEGTTSSVAPQDPDRESPSDLEPSIAPISASSQPSKSTPPPKPIPPPSSSDKKRRRIPNETDGGPTQKTARLTPPSPSAASTTLEAGTSRTRSSTAAQQPTTRSPPSLSETLVTQTSLASRKSKTTLPHAPSPPPSSSGKKRRGISNETDDGPTQKTAQLTSFPSAASTTLESSAPSSPAAQESITRSPPSLSEPLVTQTSLNSKTTLPRPPSPPLSSSGQKRPGVSDNGPPKKKARVAPPPPPPPAASDRRRRVLSSNQTAGGSRAHRDGVPARARKSTRSRLSSSSSAQKAVTAPTTRSSPSEMPSTSASSSTPGSNISPLHPSNTIASSSKSELPRSADAGSSHASSSSSTTLPSSTAAAVTPVSVVPRPAAKPRALPRDKHSHASAKDAPANLPGRPEPTRPMQFTFSVESRLKARSGEALTGTEPTPKRGASSSSSNTRHAVPDFKKIHAAQEATALKNRKPKVPVVPLPMQFSTDTRMAERSAFDERVREKERERQAQLEVQRAQREKEEEEERKEMRRNAVPKAHEVPEWYKDAPKKGD